jgi:hypothetical protein
LFTDVSGLLKLIADAVHRLEVSADDVSKAGRASGVWELDSG